LQYKFIAKLDETEVTKPWMSIVPAAGLLVPGTRHAATCRLTEESLIGPRASHGPLPCPGEKTEISLRALVNATCAGMFNKDNRSLDDIVVLHLVNGKDLFVRRTAFPGCRDNGVPHADGSLTPWCSRWPMQISTSGEYELSCFGVSLETLSRSTRPVRAPEEVCSPRAPSGYLTFHGI